MLSKVIALSIIAVSAGLNFGECIYRTLSKEDYIREWKERAIESLLAGILGIIIVWLIAEGC